MSHAAPIWMPGREEGSPMNRYLWIVAPFLLLLVLSACSGEPDTVAVSVEPTPPSSRELLVLVGAGEKTTAINVYFPRSVRIRAGDTVTWKMNTQADPQTVTFSDQRPEDDVIPVPSGGSGDSLFGGGSSSSMLNPNMLYPTRREDDPVEAWRGAGYVNSGIMFPKPHLPPGFPQIDTFSLIFDKPGVYPYFCGIHDFHKGVVVVEPQTALDVPGQKEIDEQGESEMEYYKELTGGLRVVLTSDRIMDKEAGPGGSSVYLVSAGMGPPEAELTEFIPRRLKINKGDTVVWASSRWHSVVFNPGGAFPPMYTPVEGDDGELLMVINHQVLLPVKAGEYFTGEGLYSSGLIGYGTRPGGIGYSLTFAVTGTFRYSCPIHPGMVGTIDVQDGDS